MEHPPKTIAVMKLLSCDGLDGGPFNPLENLFGGDNTNLNTAGNFVFNALVPADLIARNAWDLGNPCLGTGDRVWAGGKLAAITIAVAAGGPILRGAGRILGLGAQVPAELLLDTNVVISHGSEMLASGQPIVKASITDIELEALVSEGRVSMPRAASSIPSVANSTDIHLRINVRDLLTPRLSGNFADGIIGATALERNSTLITNDRSLIRAVNALGGTARTP